MYACAGLTDRTLRSVGQSLGQLELLDCCGANAITGGPVSCACCCALCRLSVCVHVVLPECAIVQEKQNLLSALVQSAARTQPGQSPA